MGSEADLRGEACTTTTYTRYTHTYIRMYIHVCTQSICTYILVRISYVPSKRDVQLIQLHTCTHTVRTYYTHACTQSICTYVLVRISYVPAKRDVKLIQSHSQMIPNGVSQSILGEHPRNITSLCHGMGPSLLLHCLLLLMLYVRM